MTRLISAVLFLAVFASGCMAPWGSQENEKPKKTNGENTVVPQMIGVTAQAANEKGRSASAEGKYQEALQHFSYAVKLQPKVAIFHNNLGRTWYWLGEHEKALSALLMAERLDVKNSEIKANIGDVHRQKGEYGLAATYYHYAIEIAPDVGRYHYELGNLYLKQRKLKSAESHFNQALLRDPSFSRALLGRIIVYHMTGRNELALRDIQTLENKHEMSVDQTLKGAVLKDVQNQREGKRFRPAH